MLNSKDVPIGQSALLVVDAQDSFKVDAKKWERRNNRDFENNVGRLIDAYREAKLPVIFFIHTDEDPGFGTDHPMFKLMEELQPRSTEPVIQKNTRNAFTSTGLSALLLEKGVRKVAITGIQMEQCCETTARVAADLGYAVDFVIDGTMTFPIPNWEKPGEELGVDAIRERTEYALRKRFARITTVTELEKELKERSKRAAA